MQLWLVFAAAVLLTMPAYADMFQDASNAKLPETRVNILGSLGWVESNQGLQPGYDWGSCSGYVCGQFWSTAPSTINQAISPALRIDRNATYTNDHPTLTASGTGTTATITFSGDTGGGGASTVPVGTSVLVAGVVPAGYNGIHTVTASAPGSVSFASITTGPQTVAGIMFPSTNGAVIPTMWALVNTSPTGAYHEWPITAQMYNRTGGQSGHGAQNVAINGTVFKQYSASHAYGADQIGPSFGANFVCEDQTGVANPLYGCIGTEIDTFIAPGAGTDNNLTRHILFLVAGWGGGVTSTGGHVSHGISIGTASGVTLDRAISINQGTYDVGLDFRRAGVFNTAAILGQAAGDMSIGWLDAPAQLYDATHGFAIHAAPDNNFYIDNNSGTTTVMRGISGDPRVTMTGTEITLHKPLKLFNTVGAANCTGQPSGMVIAVTGTGVLTRCP